MNFNKKLFSLLLDRARGERSWRRFAIDADISYVQMRKLALMQQENPPRLKLLKKIASVAAGDVTVDDLLFCTGTSFEHDDTKLPLSSSSRKQGELFYEKFLSLSKGQRKEIIDFIDFLSGR
ncbi:MAG: hypothetical protein J6J21_02690 [Clostridia bacterium]|nr:hypothetical protein [Clostridia bacterium]MBQ2731155.1 hypothetical protein [Clostridia bacterium]